MDKIRLHRGGGLLGVIATVFAVAFVASIISTFSAFASANLFKIQSAELTELSDTAEGTISNFGEANIASSVTFRNPGDSAKFTITLKNTDTNDHIIESITDNNENPYVSYEYDKHAHEQVNAGENLVFSVTARYSTNITDINQRAQANNVIFAIHFTDLEEEEIPVVPNTGDNILVSVIVLIVSTAGLIAIGIVALRKHHKASKLIVAGIIGLAAITTTATVKAATTDINSFIISTNFDINDERAIPYTISYNLDGGTVSGNPTSYNVETATFTLKNPTRKGFGFTGWSGTGLTGSKNMTVTIPKGSTGNRSYTAHWQADMTSIESMQQMTSEICAATAVGTSQELQDARSHDYYKITKLKDGHCWMTNNLRIDSKTITSEDSNLPDGMTWTIPRSSASGFNDYDTNNVYYDMIYGSIKGGGYYTFYAATAGWGKLSVKSGNAPYDICPKGWRLPTGGANGEYARLYYNHYNSIELMKGEPYFYFNGYMEDGTKHAENNRGYYWSATVPDHYIHQGTEAGAMDIDSKSVDTEYGLKKNLGLAVRCIAK